MCVYRYIIFVELRSYEVGRRPNCDIHFVLFCDLGQIGEDVLVHCTGCNYAANQEKAVGNLVPGKMYGYIPRRFVPPLSLAPALFDIPPPLSLSRVQRFFSSI